ncbi:MAG: hypothetical protein K0M63_10960 [Weeksellaceae bacterium]|nr:hypothetical protein [Weeksellaceae bacterium]
MKVTEKNEEKLTFLEGIANGIIWWIGSIPSLIVHTLLFLSAFLLPLTGVVEYDKMLLVLTTVLSLEAIYLAIFIQMSVNKSSEHIEILRDDVTEIQEDIEDIQEDIEEISEDLEEISDDIEDIQEDIEDIAEDEDNEDHNERAKNVMLKSNVSTNKSAIKSLRDKIEELEGQIENLKSED